MRLQMTLLLFFCWLCVFNYIISSDKLLYTLIKKDISTKTIPLHLNSIRNIYILHEMLTENWILIQFYEQFQPISIMKTCFSLFLFRRQSFAVWLTHEKKRRWNLLKRLYTFTIAFTGLSKNVRQKSSSYFNLQLLPIRHFHQNNTNR